MSGGRLVRSSLRDPRDEDRDLLPGLGGSERFAPDDSDATGAVGLIGESMASEVCGSDFAWCGYFVYSSSGGLFLLDLLLEDAFK